MYVCVCNGVTEGQIASSVAAGATSYQQLRQQLGVGQGCGKCAREIRQQLRGEAPSPCRECNGPCERR